MGYRGVPCIGLENWVYDCRDINGLLNHPITSAEDTEYCQKHYTALVGEPGDRLSQHTVSCVVKDKQCVPGVVAPPGSTAEDDTCKIQKPPFRLQSTNHHDPNAPTKCEDLSLEACPFFLGTGDSADMNCIVDYPRDPNTGRPLAGYSRQCRNADPATEPRWVYDDDIRAAYHYNSDTCSAFGTVGTTDSCLELCDFKNRGNAKTIFQYKCELPTVWPLPPIHLGDAKYCSCDEL